MRPGGQGRDPVDRGRRERPEQEREHPPLQGFHVQPEKPGNEKSRKDDQDRECGEKAEEARRGRPCPDPEQARRHEQSTPKDESPLHHSLPPSPPSPPT